MLKNCLLVSIIFYNKDHQLSIVRNNSCSSWDHFLSFYLWVILIWTNDTYFLFWIFFYFWFRSLWCAPFFYSFFICFYRSLIL